jgi:UDP:flavonoid glycosyltransferase YjiC (YdhE family)
MRIVFTPVSGLAHLFSMVPLARACRAAGHDVRVASLPELTHVTVGTGLPAVQVGHTIENALRLPGGHRLTRPSDEEEARRNRDGRLEGLTTVARVMAADLLRFAERWRPNLVITDPLVFAAPLVSATSGIPLIRHVWGPDIWRGFSHPMQGKPADGDAGEQWPAGLIELYDRFGVAVRNDHATGTVDPWPTSLQLPGTPGRIPMRYVPYNGAAVAPDWVLDRPSRPRVCVTWGTTTTILGGEDLSPLVVEALASLDIEVVLALGSVDREKLGAVPGNIRVAENLPLHLLMPTCDAIVNQAGAGTLLTAACHGVPQVLIPQTAESPFNAAHFSKSGAGLTLNANEADTESIRAAVTGALTDDTIRAAAHRLRDEIAATPPPSDVVHRLEQAARFASN